MVFALIFVFIIAWLFWGSFTNWHIRYAQDSLMVRRIITIRDSADRSVRVPYPVKTVVVLWKNPAEEMKALGAIERIIGLDKTTKEEVDKGLYPELADRPLVGSCKQPNYEKIAQLKPDVVIMLSSYPPLPDEIQQKLKPFDIPVVGLDFYRVEDYFNEVKILGSMLGLENKANQYLEFFRAQYRLIDSRIRSLPPERRKRVYFEGNDYKTYGGAGYGAGIPGIIRAAGGLDLYPESPAIEFEADPEDVAVKNPQVIFKGVKGGYFLKNTAEFERLRNELMRRPELAATEAVRNNQVYIISWDVTGGARKKFGPIFLAKVLYPDLFKDMEPLSFLKEYFEEYQNLRFQGVYLYPAVSEQTGKDKR